MSDFDQAIRHTYHVRDGKRFKDCYLCRFLEIKRKQEREDRKSLSEFMEGRRRERA